MIAEQHQRVDVSVLCIQYMCIHTVIHIVYHKLTIHVIVKEQYTL